MCFCDTLPGYRVTLDLVAVAAEEEEGFRLVSLVAPMLYMPVPMVHMLLLEEGVGVVLVLVLVCIP